ncbi:MAG: carboxymuconolactone decarboxylase family protein [Methanomicrobiaceae archaeon]|nr:carboxymuconolactone decarboxylase family protein [Methanomicrobiaceae archaeon]
MNFEAMLKEIGERGLAETAEECLRKIEEESGAVPLIFRRMAGRPEVLLSHLLYKNAVTETSSIEPKYVELISLAVSAALNCSHCVEYHMNTALKKGATREEILEVILIAGSLANASVLADAYRVVDPNGDPCGASCDVNGVGLKHTLKSEK